MHFLDYFSKYSFQFVFYIKMKQISLSWILFNFIRRFGFTLNNIRRIVFLFILKLILFWTFSYSKTQDVDLIIEIEIWVLLYKLFDKS
jgi:hypothetical protein